MARRTETGIQYFPINTDIVFNRKVQLVVAEFGPRAWAVLLPLYCKLYREKGYWLDWCDEDAKILFAKNECQLELAYVTEVVAGCIRRGLFDQSVYEMFGVLTNDRVQQNYLEAKKRSKDLVMIGEFLCPTVDLPDNVNILPLNVNILSKNVDTGTQNRIEENRIKENSKAQQFAAMYASVDKSDKGAISTFIKTHKPLLPDPYVDLWKLFAAHYKKPGIEKLTDKRRRWLMQRISEPAFDYLAILKRARESSFLLNASFFGFDWIIQNQENYLKVLEGKYADNTATPVAASAAPIDPTQIAAKHDEAAKAIEQKYGQ